MKTIIGLEEKYNRNNENSLTKKQQELHDLKAMILPLKESRLNNTKMAEKLGIDRKKVGRIVNSIIS